MAQCAPHSTYRNRPVACSGCSLSAATLISCNVCSGACCCPPGLPQGATHQPSPGGVKHCVCTSDGACSRGQQLCQGHPAAYCTTVSRSKTGGFHQTCCNADAWLQHRTSKLLGTASTLHAFHTCSMPGTMLQQMCTLAGQVATAQAPATHPRSGPAPGRLLLRGGCQSPACQTPPPLLLRLLPVPAPVVSCHHVTRPGFNTSCTRCCCCFGAQLPANLNRHWQQRPPYTHHVFCCTSAITAASARASLRAREPPALPVAAAFAAAAA